MTIYKQTFRLIIASLLFITTISISQAAVTCSTNKSCTGPISEMVTAIFPTAVGDALFTAPVLIQSLGCNGVNGYNNFILPGSHGTFAQTYQTALTAIALDKEVTIRRDTNESTCTILYLRMEL